MDKVTVLVEGYARKKNNRFEASPSTVLIRTRGKYILVDPGCNEKLLLGALKKEGVKPQDIEFIFLTHYHIDHLMNIALFPGKPIVDGDTIYSEDMEISYSGVLPGTDIEVVATPGHAHEHAALLIKTDKGIVAVGGDLWWWEDGNQKTDFKSLISLKDPFVKNEEDLFKSRETLLMKADYVIPGHGRMFKVPKKEVLLWNASKNKT